MSTKIEESKIEGATPIGKPLVKHCPCCGVGFRANQDTNIYFRCEACEKIIQVRTKAEE
jgi:uncharacterized protein (DUF983 family)|tara:strand:- start:574 stop:750 length:177 start_codon:yes stop_codon:yes gene_type:complete